MIFGWILFWSLWALPAFNSYLMQRPEFPVWQSFLLHQTGYWLSLFFIGYILTGELPKSLRFSIGIICLLIAWEISVPPTCIAPDGNALITSDNQLCRLGNDFFVSWMLNSYLKIPYGQPIMFYSVYIIGTLAFAFVAVILLKERELWEALIGGIFG